MSRLKFEPLYHAGKIHVINPTGDVGVVTLWSRVEQGLKKFGDIDPQLVDPSRSRIAAISNLYGDGMFAMFCNLLNNPQIKYLIAVGQDMGLSVCAEIEAFIREGLEEAKVLGKPMSRIKGTNRYFPITPGFDENVLRGNLSFRYFGKFSLPNFCDEITKYFEELPPPQPTLSARIPVTISELGSADYEYLPSDPLTHQVIRKKPLHCWEELVVRVMRFGRPVELRKGLRLELQNVRAIITAPDEESAEALEKYGFQLKQFHAYQKKILDPLLPENISYTYGNRLRGYFAQKGNGRETLQTVVGRLDALETVIDRLKDDPETRHCYIALWDTAHDLVSSESDDDTAVPCLTTLFFRRSQGTLQLTATYRSHNLLTAWLENVYGLMAIQRHVAGQIGIPIGPITVISHSLGIDPKSTRYTYGEGIRSNWKTDDDFDHGKYVLREDPNGYFVVTVDEEKNELVAEHRHGGVLIKRYQGTRAEEIEKEVAKDMAITLISHAMWLGRELTRNEQDLKLKVKKTRS